MEVNLTTAWSFAGAGILAMLGGSILNCAMPGSMWTAVAWTAYGWASAVAVLMFHELARRDAGRRKGRE